MMIDDCRRANSDGYDDDAKLCRVNHTVSYSEEAIRARSFLGQHADGAKFSLC